jgi:hypothetical protein
MFFRHGFPRVGSHTKYDNLNAFHGSRRWYAPAAVPRNPQVPDSPEPTPAFATVLVASSLPAQTNTTISPSSSITMASSNTPSPYRPVPPNDPPIPLSNPPGRRPDSLGGGSGIPATGSSIPSGDPIFGGSSKPSDSSGGGLTMSGGASSGLNVPLQSTSPDVAASHYSSTVAAPGLSSSPGVNVSGGTNGTKASGFKKGAAIAVGVTLAFVTFLGFIVFLHYRRSRKRRFQSRNHWFFSRKRTSGEKRPTSRARSSWSSFETPIENSSLHSSPLMPDGTNIDDQKQVVGYSRSPTDGVANSKPETLDDPMAQWSLGNEITYSSSKFPPPVSFS